MAVLFVLSDHVPVYAELLVWVCFCFRLRDIAVGIATAIATAIGACGGGFDYGNDTNVYVAILLLLLCVVRSDHELKIRRSTYHSSKPSPSRCPLYFSVELP